MNDNVFVKDIKTKKAFKDIKQRRLLVDANTDSLYPHLSFKIENIVDYIEIINLLSQTIKNESFINREIIYRGMADKGWGLTPALGRCNNIDANLEYNLVNRFINLAPAEFAGLNTSFEILSKMQHYGLPTRLLDFTTNPLIALFFACSELIEKKDARIVCHRAFVKIANDEIIENVCGLFNNYNFEDMRLDDLKVSEYKYLHRLYMIKDDHLLVARPSFWNKRIQNQEAVFMIFPNKLYDQFACWAYGGEDNYPQFWEDDKYRDILENVKKEPLDKIYIKAAYRDFYINHDTIGKLFEFYKDEGYSSLKKWGETFKHRFRFDSELDVIDNYNIKNEFCSILIDKKRKKIILEQLKQLGIDKSFVYPELQYVAEKIKDMYVE